MKQLNGFYCMTHQDYNRTTGTYNTWTNHDIKYYFENDHEIYYTTCLDNHIKKHYISRIWDDSFKSKLVEV